MSIQSNKVVKTARNKDNDLNYAALAVSIYKDVPVEAAFNLLFGRSPREIYITTEDIHSMYQCRKNGRTYSQVAKEFGISTNAVYCRIMRYCKKNNLALP